MADSLFNILKTKDFDEPPQLVAVKAYIKRHWNVEVNGKTNGDNIILQVPSAALAGTLRMHLPAIRKECGLQGKLIIKIRG